MDYEALVAPADVELQTLTIQVNKMLEDSTAQVQTQADVKETAMLCLHSLTGISETLEVARLRLAVALHNRGVGFRQLADALGTSTMTARRWILDYKAQQANQADQADTFDED